MIFKLSAQIGQYSTNLMRSPLRLFGLHRDVNDAHRAGANRLQNKNKRQDNEGNPKEPETNAKKRKTGESSINRGGASSPTADTPKSEESEHASNVESNTQLTWCIAAVNKILCDMPSVDLCHGRTAQTGNFPEDAVQAGRELALGNMFNFDAFELIEELPAGKHAHDMVWVDEWRGDRVWSLLCVRQFKAEGPRDDLFAGTPYTFFIKYLLTKAANCKDFGILVIDISVAFIARSNR